jgi:hypothetical protein
MTRKEIAMEHIAALLLIVGCSGDLKECSELPAPTSIFETFEDCQAELKPALTAFTGQRDKVLGQCIFVDPAMEEEDAELVWDVKADGTLVGTVEAVPSDMIASDQSAVPTSTSR